MTKINQNVEMWEGTYTEIPITVLDADGAPFNLSGATLVWKMCVDDAAGTVLLTKTPSVVSASAGTCKVTLVATDTATLGGKSYYQELGVTSSAHPEVGLTGTITINRAATA